MTVNSYGVYVSCLSCLNVVTALGQTGIDQLLVRFIPVYASERDSSSSVGLLRWAVRRVGLTITGVVTLALLAVAATKKAIPDSSLEALLPAILCIVPMTLSLVLRSALLGVQKPVRATMPQAILTPLAHLLAVAAFVWLKGEKASSGVVMQARLAAATLELLLVAWWLRTEVGDSLRKMRPRYHETLWKVTAAPLFAQTAMKFIGGNIHFLLLGVLATSRESGIFGAALRLAYVPLIAITAAEFVCAPLLAQMYAARRSEDLRRTYFLSAAVPSVLTVAAFAVLLFAGRWILALLGPDYAAGYGSMMILLVGVTVRSVLGPADVLLTMTGSQKIAATITAFSAVVAFVANLVLIPAAGGLGAAFATTLAITANSVAMAIVAYRRLGIMSLIPSRLPPAEYVLETRLEPAETLPN